MFRYTFKSATFQFILNLKGLNFNMLNFALLDDNNELLNEMHNMLESIFLQHNFDGNVGIKTTNIDDFFDYINHYRVDVIILDIHLGSGLTGIQIANLIRKTNRDCYIIFATAHFEYVQIAYKYKTFDFLSKPVNKERLENCIIRLFDDISYSKDKFLIIPNDKNIIPERTIIFIEKNGMKIIIHTKTFSYEIYSTLSQIQHLLPNNFVRCHKSYIVNVENILDIDTKKNTVSFSSISCGIGPTYKNNFLEMVKKYEIV